MKKALVMPLLFLSLRGFCPNSADQEDHLKELVNNLEKNNILETNLHWLKQGHYTYKDRNKVAELVKPLIKEYSEKYLDTFNLQKDELVNVITVLFLSESANSKGSPASSRLWIEHNNPFGMTGPGVRFLSWEEENGKRVNQYRNFRSYTSFELAVKSLFEDFLLKGRYKRLRQAKNYRQWFYTMYYCGYMTGSCWPRMATKFYEKYL